MSGSLTLREAKPGALTIGREGAGDLWTYGFEPGTPANESPRPFVHPLYSIHGDILTNWRPNDHPWHHGLSFTLTVVDGVNFWGGPSHRTEDGYQWRDDHGRQLHVSWLERSPDRLVENLHWCTPRSDETVIVEEQRTFVTDLREDGWTLRWRSQLHNPTRRDLVCHNYHSLGGLKGSHYSGLQFRGARGLLDQHGDAAIGLRGEQDHRELAELHGKPARWLEWHAQHDGSLRRTRIRFESLSGPMPWFVRPNDPLVAFSPHDNEPWVLPAGETRELDHLLHFLTA